MQRLSKWNRNSSRGENVSILILRLPGLQVSLLNKQCIDRLRWRRSWALTPNANQFKAHILAGATWVNRVGDNYPGFAPSPWTVFQLKEHNSMSCFWRCCSSLLEVFHAWLILKWGWEVGLVKRSKIPGMLWVVVWRGAEMLTIAATSQAVGVAGANGGPQSYLHILTLRLCKCDLIWTRELCRCD